MESNYIIDPSLQKKIYENDMKFKSILNKGLLSKKGSTQNNKSQINKKKKIEVAKEKDNINSNSNHKNNLNSNNKNNNLIQNKEKIMKLKEDKEKKKYNTNFVLNMSKDSNKQRPNNININEKTDRTYNNNNKKNKNKKIIKEEEKNKNSKSFINFNRTIERFEQDIKKRNENIEKKKILKEKIEKEKYTYKPSMCKGSKKYNEYNIKENFLERQQNFIDKKEQNREIIKTEINKEEEEKIQSAPNQKLENFRNYLNSMEKWEKERIDKIERKKRELEEKMENEFDYIPKIDEKSAKIAEKNKLRQKQPNTFIRLAEQDKILKEKKKILTEMYTPTFKPFCYEPLNLNIKNPAKNFFEENYANELEQEEIEDIYEEREEEEEEKEIIDDFDFQQDIMKFTDDQVDDTLRGNIFNHKKKNKK